MADSQSKKSSKRAQKMLTKIQKITAYPGNGYPKILRIPEKSVQEK